MIASSGGPSAAATKIATVGASTGAGAYAESNATNAAVNELAYYAYSRGFATAVDNLDPAIPWSKNVKKGHVAVHIGCTSKHGGPKTFAVSSSCDHGKLQALVLQSEASDGSVCYSIIADESGLQTVWSTSTAPARRAGRARHPSVVQRRAGRAGTAASRPEAV